MKKKKKSMKKIITLERVNSFVTRVYYMMLENNISWKKESVYCIHKDGWNSQKTDEASFQCITKDNKNPVTRKYKYKRIKF